MEVKAAHARIADAAAVVARISDLHPPPATPAAHQPLQQRTALARGAAALAARPHVGAQSLAGREVFLPGDIAGMVLGQADRPLLHRHLDRPRPALARRRPGASPGVSAEHERAGIDRVGQELVHRAIARAGPSARAAHRPSGAAAAGRRRSARRRPDAPSRPRHSTNTRSIAWRTCSSAHSTIRSSSSRSNPTGRCMTSSPRAALLRSPPSRRARIRVKLCLGHRSLQPEQQPVVEIAPANRSRQSRRSASPSARTGRSADASPPSSAPTARPPTPGSARRCPGPPRRPAP